MTATLHSSRSRRRATSRAAALVAAAGLFVAGCGSQNENRNSAASPVEATEVAAPGPATENTPAPDAAAAPEAATVAPTPELAAPTATGTPTAADASRAPSSAAAPAKASAPAPRTAGSPAAGAKPAPANPTQASAKSNPATPAGAPAPSAPAAPAPGGAASPAAPGPAAGAATKSEIVLGSFGQETGPLGALFVPVIAAAKAWAADVNARGGLNGHPVRVIFADDGGDPARALAVARNFVEKDKVLAVFAEHGPVTISAVMPYLEKVGVPRIGSVEGNVAVDRSAFSFQATTGAEVGTPWAHILPLIADPSIKKIHTVYCREIEHCKFMNDLIVKELAPQIGLEVVGQSQSSLAQPDYTPEVLAAKGEGAQAIVSIMENATTVRIARTVKRQGGGLVVVSQQATNSESFYKNGGDDVEGVMLASPTVEYSSSPKMADYRNAMKRYQPGAEKSGFGSSAWAHGKLLEAAAKNLSDNPTPAELLDGLYGLRDETLGGILPPLTFPRGRSHENVNHCVIIGKVEGNKFVPKDGDPDKFTCAPGWKTETPN